MNIHSPHLHNSSLPSASKAIDEFFGPIHLVSNWISGSDLSVYEVVNQTKAEQQEEEAVKYLEQKRAIRDKYAHEIEKGEREIQESLATSFFVRMGTYVTVVVVGIAAFLLVLLLVYVVSILVQSGLTHLDSVYQTKIGKGLKYAQFLVCGVDSILLCIYLIKLTLLLIIKGKVLN